jgi:hypothetical protein
VRRRVAPLALLIFGALALLIGASIPVSGLLEAMHNRAVFGTFDTTGAPPRVDYCGRRYYPGDKSETLAEVKAFLLVDQLHGLTQIDSAPSGMPIVTNVIPTDVRAAYHTNVCAMVLWVQTGPDAYLGYSLSGGP